MKTLALIIYLAAAACAPSADFTASAFFQTPVSLEDGECKPAAGVLFRSIFRRGWGVQTELIQSAIEDTFIDRSAIHAVYSHVIDGPWSVIGFAGVGRDWEDRETGAEVGAGIERSVGKITLGLNLRAQRDEGDDWIAVPTISAGWRF